jgi:alcohol dehydrogenase class IV
MAQWQVSVPTTLSAGEFAPYAGCTDPATKVKETYVSQLQLISSVKNRGLSSKKLGFHQ